MAVVWVGDNNIPFLPPALMMKRNDLLLASGWVGRLGGGEAGEANDDVFIRHYFST